MKVIIFSPRDLLNKKSLVSFLFVILLVGTGCLGYLYYQSTQEIIRLKDPLYAGQLQAEYNNAIIAAVGKIMVLPSSKPNIVYITDANSLKQDNPDFYGNAMNDDVIIIYDTIAIIYRQSENKIINTAPIVIPSISATPDINL